MIRSMAASISKFIIRYHPESDYEVLVFGYEILIYEIFLIGTALLISFIFHNFCLMLVNIVIFTVLRKSAGGMHANSRIVCGISYFLFVFGIIFLSYWKLPVWLIVAFYIINNILLVVYAPADTAEMPITERKLQRKIFSIAFMTLCYLAGLYLLTKCLDVYANVLFLCPTVVSCLMHPLVYRLFRCKRSNIQSIFG